MLDLSRVRSVRIRPARVELELARGGTLNPRSEPGFIAQLRQVLKDTAAPWACTSGAGLSPEVWVNLHQIKHIHIDEVPTSGGRTATVVRLYVAPTLSSVFRSYHGIG